MKRLLVIDDRPEIGVLVLVLVLVLAIAKRLGYVCDYASTFTEFKCLLVRLPDVIVIDLTMPDIDGIEVLRFLEELQCRAGILLLSNAERRVLIGIGASLAARPLPHHRAYGSVHGDSAG